MSANVLVFSADPLRGKIIEKVLDRNGFECLIFNRILETADEIAQHDPEVVIVDTENCISEEINHLRNVCQKLKNMSPIILGKETVIENFKGLRFRKALCLFDPLDPELIAVKAKEIVSRKKKKWICTEGNVLEKTVKQLLDLD